MKDEWFIRSKLDNNTFGPYTAKLLETYIKDGRVGKNFVLSQDKTNWSDVESWSPPRMMGKYEILDELGRGGMGAVYLAYDSDLQRECAIKVILSKDDKEAIKRFQIEAKAVAQIKHPNIIHIYDIHEEPHHFFVMDYIKGIPLNQYTVNLSIDEKVELFSKICEAMVCAHRKNILHRDLKPANILVRKNGEPVIVDFGLAKNSKQENDLTKTGEIFGTLKYMAPEITRGKRGTYQVDVYALGVILYEMLTGRVPFDGENQMELLYQLTLKEPIPPSVLNTSIPREGSLETICLKALEKAPERRIASTKFLHKEIQSYIAKEPIRLKPPNIISKIVKGVLKYKVPIFAGLLIFISIWFYFWTDNQFQKKQQQKEKIANLETTEKFLNSQERVFDGYTRLVEANKKTIDDYLLSKNDEQFFHLAVIKKFKDLNEKIQAEELLYEAHDQVTKTIDFLSSEINNAKELKYRSKKLLAFAQRLKEKPWSHEYYEKHKKENARYYQRLDNHLRFSVLPNFPEKKSYEFKKKSLSVCVSPMNNYILQKNEQGNWKLWQKSKTEWFSQENVFTLNGLPRNLEKSKCVFSPDEKLIVIGEQNYLYFIDVVKKRKIISFEGSFDNISFDAQNRYVCFLSSKNEKRLIRIYDRKNSKVIKEFHCKYLLFTDFCKDTLVVAHNKTISTYNLKTKKLEHTDVDIVGIRVNIALDKKKQQLFLLSRLTLSSFDVVKKTIKTFPYEFSGLGFTFNKKGFIVIGQSQLALLRNSGEVVISYHNLFSTKKSTQITNRRLLRRNDDSIYKLDFAPHYFLGIFKENSIDIVNTINGEKIITIDKKYNFSQTNDPIISDGQLNSLPNGLLVSLLTKKNYEEYFFPFEKYSVDNNTKEIIQHFMSVYKTGAEIGRSTLVGKNFIIYTSMVAFLVWKNKKFVGHQKVLKSPYNFKLSSSNNYLAINYRLNEIHLYKTKNFNEPVSTDILGFEGRRFIKKNGGYSEITSTLFSKDDKDIFLAQPSLQLFAYNILTKKVRKISSLKTSKSLKLIDMVQLQNR